MGKRYTKKIIKKTRVKLTPRDAKEILKREISDKYGNKHIYRIRFEPQNPFNPDFKQTSTVRYKAKEGEDE